MNEYLELGPTPADEACAQVGTDDYAHLARHETAVYVEQLTRSNPPPPAGAGFRVKSFPHDFGHYYEVVAYYSTEAGQDWAYAVEENLPESWDDEARAALSRP